MALRGSLDDVPIVDVLQFVHMSGKSGALSLESSAGQAWIEFSNGNIAFARGPSTRSLGAILTERGLIAPGDIDRLLAHQLDGAEPVPLGRLLLQNEVVTAEQLADCVRQQVHETMLVIARWKTGEFFFSQGTVIVADEIRVSVEEVLPLVQMNTQHVLLEAARVQDELTRSGESHMPPPTLTPPGANPFGPSMIMGEAVEETPASARILPAPELLLERKSSTGQPAANAFSGGVVLVGFEKRSAMEIRRELTEARRRVLGHVPFADLGRVFPSTRRLPRALVFLWRLRGDSDAALRDNLKQMETVIARESGSSHVVLLTGGVRGTIASLYRLGVRAVLPIAATVEAEMEGITSIVDQICKENTVASNAQAAELRAWQQAKTLTESMHQALQKANVALEFMRVAANTLDRATLFLSKRGELFALGAFGKTASGRPMAESIRGLAVQIADETPLARSLAERRVICDAPQKLGLGPLFFKIAGEPKASRALLVPLIGPSKTIGVLYADNGQRDRAPGATHALEIAAAHAGIAYENAVLRLRLSNRPEGAGQAEPAWGT
jgi:hypothetical protein